MERRSTRTHRKEEEAEEDSSGDYDAAKTTKPLSRALKCIQAFNKFGNIEGNTETTGGKRRGDGDRGGGLGLNAASASTRSGRGTRVGGGGGGVGTNAASASLRTKQRSSRRGTDSTTGNDDEGVAIDNSDKKRKNTKTTQNKSNKKTTMTKVTKQRLRLHYHGTDVGDEDEDDNKEEWNQQAVNTKEEDDNDKNERKRQHKAVDIEKEEEGEEVGDDDDADENERKKKAEEGGEEEEEEEADYDDDDDDGGGRHRRNNDTERYQQQKKRQRSSKSSSLSLKKRKKEKGNDGDAEGGGNSLPNTSKNKKSRNDDRKWLAIYQRLVRYMENNGGSTKVPKNYSNDSSLGRWVHKQRVLNNKNSIKPERRTKLDLIHFDWGEGKQPPREDWETMFNRLVVYQQNNNGSTKVPRTYQDDLPLGNWVSKQREGYNNKSMKPERRTKLDLIHFDSGEGPRSRNNWETMFNRLVAYKKNNGGSTKVPKNYSNDSSLGRWVHKQRVLNNKNSIKPERRTKLELIHFDFAPSEDAWMTMYHRLVTYQKKNNGSTKVSQTDDLSLSYWVNKQRKDKHKNIILPTRRKLLESIKFDWGKGLRGPRGPLPFGNRSLCGDESTVANDSIQIPKCTSMRRLQKFNRSSNKTIPQNIASVSFVCKNSDGEYDDLEFDDDEVDEIDNNDDDDKNDDDDDARKPAATQSPQSSSFLAADTDSTSKDKNTATTTQITEGNGATMTDEGQGRHNTSNAMSLAPYGGDDVRYNSDGMPLVPGQECRHSYLSFVAAKILQATAAVSSTATVDNAEAAQDDAAVAATGANDDVQNITHV